MKTVIIYEGLFGFLLGNRMTTAFKEAMPDYPYEKRSWLTNKEIPKGSVVLGHSFGAYKAWEYCKGNGHSHLITVDLRWWSGNKDYERHTLSNHSHFFQLSPLRGYRLRTIHGGTERNLGFYGHMKSPSHPLVIAKIREIMGE